MTQLPWEEDHVQPSALPRDDFEFPNRPRRIAIIGGGLSGLAAAVALADLNGRQADERFAPLSIELFESRRQLGGRASSFRDPTSGELVDHCQHVSLGCCTNLADFCHRAGLSDLIRRDRTITFMSLDGQPYSLAGSRWLPAPLHLLPSLLGLRFLSVIERVRIVLALRGLAAESPDDRADHGSIDDWLRAHNQSDRAIELFWQPVIVSALSEEPARTSVAAARKVFVDGLMRSRGAYEMLVPRVPLSQLYGARLIEHLQARGVTISLGHSVRKIRAADNGQFAIQTESQNAATFDAVIVALPWRAIAKVIDVELLARLPSLSAVDQFESASITGVHLWFDRAITELPHAVLPGRLSQWLFNRGAAPREIDAREIDAGDDVGEIRPGDQAGGNAVEHYYQVVISASNSLAQLSRDEIVAQVQGELVATWPAACDAVLMRWRVVTEQHAVFSPRPGSDANRPTQATAVPGLFLAGDWTATSWPATMEGAVRGGYLAAEALLQYYKFATPDRRILVADLPVARLSRWFLGIR